MKTYNNLLLSTILLLNVGLCSLYAVSPLADNSKRDSNSKAHQIQRYMNYQKALIRNSETWKKNKPEKSKYDMDNPAERALYERLRMDAFRASRNSQPVWNEKIVFEASDMNTLRNYLDDPLLQNITYKSLADCVSKSTDTLLRQELAWELLPFAIDSASNLHEGALSVLLRTFCSDAFSGESRVSIAKALEQSYQRFTETASPADQKNEGSEAYRHLLSSMHLAGRSRSLESVSVLAKIARIDSAFFLDEKKRWVNPIKFTYRDKSGYWMRTLSWQAVVAMAQIGDKEALQYFIRLMDAHPDQMSVAYALFPVAAEIKHQAVAKYLFDRVPIDYPASKNTPPLRNIDPDRLSYGDRAFLALRSLVSEKDEKRWWIRGSYFRRKDILQDKSNFLKHVNEFEDLTLDLR